MNDLHGILFAYRSNANLGELTRPRNTCSLPFGGRYRLVDFMLSSYVNAGITDVGLIVHKGYQSLLDHVGSGKDWELSRKHGGLRILPPFSFAEQGRGEYQGCMEALTGVQSYLENIRQDYVILAWGDIAVNLPVADIFQQHVDSGADITMVCTRTDCGSCETCEYITLDDGGRVNDLLIHPKSLNGELESLEIYVMSKKLLLELVEYAAAHDLALLSRDIVRPRLNTLNVRPYIYEGYVARFASVTGYFEKSMDLLEAGIRDNLFNNARPIRTKDQSNPSAYYGPDAKAANSLVADGCFIEGEVENSVLFRGVVVEKGAKVSNCVLMQGTVVGEGASITCVIADKNVRINAGCELVGHKTYPIAIAKDSVV